MELGSGSEQQQKHSPDHSAHDSTEVSLEPPQAIQASHLMQQLNHPHSNLYARLASSSDHHHQQQQQQLSFFQHSSDHNLLHHLPAAVKEEPHGQARQIDHGGILYTAPQLQQQHPWDQAHELTHSMSPESADLCKNLLEILRKEFGTCYAESSSSSHHLLGIHEQQHQLQHQEQQEQQAATTAAPSSITTSDQKTNLVTTASAVLPAGSEMTGSTTVSHPENEMLKAAIISHPQYPELVAAHMNCHKVGAPPEVATQIDEIIQSFKSFQPPVTTSIGVNQELDQFMISYYTMLMKYEKEIKKTFKEAVAFCKKLEQQLQGVTNTSLSSVASVESDDRNDGYETSDEDHSSAEVEIEVDPMAKDKELKEQLMRKYSGYISSLKHEFLKKKKKGKLPKDSRQQLLDWWSVHYKWPYPSEAEKASLAESTGLDQKQINNWFINQRKRHWKPADELGGQALQNSVTEANSGA